jgi:hypothetical protein
MPFVKGIEYRVGVPGYVVIRPNRRLFEEVVRQDIRHNPGCISAANYDSHVLQGANIAANLVRPQSQKRLCRAIERRFPLVDGLERGE